jgi:hypothetical protein
MELSLRPYVTAGVVVAGAGLIVAAPLGPSAVQIQTRAVQLTAVEGLAADLVGAAAAPQEFPVSTLADVFTNAFANLQSLGSEFSGNLTPILTAIIDNMGIYTHDLLTAAEGAGTSVLNALHDFPTVISNALSDLASGDVFDAETSIFRFLTQTPLSVVSPLENGFFEVVQSMANHLSNLLAGPETGYDAAADALLPSSAPPWVTEFMQAALMVPHAAELSVAGVSQDIADAVQEGNSGLAFSDLVHAPATILDAVLNGYNLGDDGGGGMAKLVDAVPEALQSVSAQGLLSENGVVATIHEAMQTMARDISPVRAEEIPLADAAAAASAGADVHSLAGDITTLLSPDTALGDIVTAFDPNAIADITSLLTGDLAPTASGWAAELLTLF